MSLISVIPKDTTWVATVLVVVAILVLLIWSVWAGDLTMWLLLLAAGLGAISQLWKKGIY